MTATALPTTAGVALTQRWRRFAAPALVLVAIVVVGAVIGHKPPSWLDAHVKPWVDDLYDWVVRHRENNLLFTLIFNPIAATLRWANDAVLWQLRILRWPGVVALAGVVGYRTGGRRASLTGVVLLIGCGVLGVWDDTMKSLTLMSVSVVVALLLGVPLGVWMGLSKRTTLASRVATSAVQAVLDAFQVMPAFVYLLPCVVLFGIADPPAVVATVIFAMAPAVRLTAHGLRSVPLVSEEVGTAFGCTRRQLLLKVQLPLAQRAILLGLNQVIMMAFGLVVLAALVGTGGLGGDVLAGLQKVNVGKAFVPGLAIVFLAIALDRISTGDGSHRTTGRQSAFARRLATVPGRVQATVAVGIVVVVAVVAKMAGANDFPGAWQFDPSGSVNTAVTWVNDHFRHGVPVVGGTGTFSDFLVRDVLRPMSDGLIALPWWVVIAAIVAIAWVSGGHRLALVCGACMVGIGALRVWDLAMDTLSQVLVAVLISVAIAVPLGIIAGRSDRFERAIRPLLDAAQVLPQFVYLVPVVFLFNVGRVPGVIASVIYAIPPGIRLTSLGLRQVPVSPREAAVSFGATRAQELMKVQLPLALRSVMLGINQTIMMVLSMVVVAALIGAGALGLETVYGLSKSEIGRGAVGGLAIVLLAIVLDRTTQAWGTARTATRRGHS